MICTSLSCSVNSTVSSAIYNDYCIKIHYTVCSRIQYIILRIILSVILYNKTTRHIERTIIDAIKH